MSTRPKSSRICAAIFCVAAWSATSSAYSLGRVGAERVNFVRRFLRVFGRAADRRDARTFAREPKRDGMTNPPPGSGNDCDLIFQLHGKRLALSENIRTEN